MLLSVIGSTEQLRRPSNNATATFWHKLLAILPLVCLIGFQMLRDLLKNLSVDTTAFLVVPCSILWHALSVHSL